MRYVLVGGHIWSRTGLEAYYINPFRLAVLYDVDRRVPYSLLVFLHDVQWEYEYMGGRDPNSYYTLRPREDGEYKKAAEWLRGREGCDDNE